MITFIDLGNAGRFCNGLFQIAATIGFAKKYNVPFIFPNWEYQNSLNIPSSSFTNRESINFSNKYEETVNTYSEIPFIDNCSLYGYFQSQKYFDNCSDYIRKIFMPSQKSDNLEDYCCIHVRRGDYLRYPKHHPLQPIQYYMKAAELIPVKKFMVFSDDVEWCRRNFTGNEFTINETHSVISDFSKMINCSNFIIANSTFSWWAAWLCGNKNKVVIAPCNWFGPAYSTWSIKDLIPPEWILI